MVVEARLARPASLACCQQRRPKRARVVGDVGANTATAVGSQPASCRFQVASTELHSAAIDMHVHADMALQCSWAILKRLLTACTGLMVSTFGAFAGQGSLITGCDSPAGQLGYNIS